VVTRIMFAQFADDGGRWWTLASMVESVLGRPLASSNLASSATSDQPIHQAGHGPV